MSAGLPVLIAALSLAAMCPIFVILWWLEKRQRKGLQNTFGPVTRAIDEANKLIAEAEHFQESIDMVKSVYAEKRVRLEQLEQQIAIYDDRLALAELGLYEPHFDFTDSEQFKGAIQGTRAAQKQLISLKRATINPENLTVDGSRSKGETMVNRQSRLTLRAFNAECDAAVANTRWNNAIAMEKRITTAFDQVNKENSSLGLKISDEYLSEKLKELRLTHEYRERQKAEKEERAELARADREERKLLADAEAADREERKYQSLLDKAKSEAQAQTGGMTVSMAKRIADLEKALADAHSASDRARAMAEMTKSGYVYIISNVGSFGENVVKIGLTRRLDPDDRVRELGDASVPFSFDVHAMVYSDEAPALEFALHQEFASRRINLTNLRKEFFSVSLDEVEMAVARLAPDASFFKDREAQEWHETLARRNQSLADMQTPASSFPASI